MDTGCRAVGIEKEMNRHQTALRLLKQCNNVEPGLVQRVLLLCKDLTQADVDLTEATVILVNNWCFDQELHIHLLDLFGSLNEGTRIVCTKKLLGQRNSRKRSKAETLT